MTPPPATLSAPTGPGERLPAIDILRGAALLGILLVNMLAFSGPWIDEVTPLSYWSSPADRWAEWGVLVLAEGASYSAFSLLFGLGFALQLRRGERRDEAALPRYRRRLLWLLAIGLVHLLLIWFGDILTHYALIGLLLLPFARTPVVTLLRWSAALLALASLLYLAAGGAVTSDRLSGDAAELVRLYRDGGFGDILAQRLDDGITALIATPLLVPGLLWLFLLGFAAGRARLFSDLAGSAPLLRRVRALALSVALVCKGLYGWLLLARPDNPFGLLLSTGLGGPALGLVYLSSLALLLSDPAWLARLRPLAALGRMALSNYLAHSLVFTLLFYGYGAGLYGRLGPATTLGFALGMIALQLTLSREWLARFRFGPVEWLWRSLTYGRAQPWRRGGER
jgi:uncharacterized protein